MIFPYFLDAGVVYKRQRYNNLNEIKSNLVIFNRIVQLLLPSAKSCLKDCLQNEIFSTGMIFTCNQLYLDSTAFNISPITSFSSAGFPMKTN